MGSATQKVRGWPQLISVQHTVFEPPATSFIFSSAKFLTVSFASTSFFVVFFFMKVSPKLNAGDVPPASAF